MILALRTDSPEAWLALCHDDGTEAKVDIWQANRTLAHGLLAHIDGLLQSQLATWQDITAIVVFQGPGSFTGLRIGLTVANTLAYASNCPIVGAKGDDWLAHGLARLARGDNDHAVMPLYGAAPRITTPRK